MTGKKRRTITPDVEQEIIGQIDVLAARSKNGKVIWSQIEKASGFTKAAMNAKENIKRAYIDANKTVKKKRTQEEEIAELTKEVEQLNKQITGYKNTIKKYDQKYVRWLYNATNANLTEEQLNMPIPHSIKTSERKKSVK